jgi:alanine-synthesizing transaminase
MKPTGHFTTPSSLSEGVLHRAGQRLRIERSDVRETVEGWVADPDMPADKRFVYYLLAAKGVCVVPLSSFCSDLMGFRITLLEENQERLIETFTRIREGIEEYLTS